MSKAKTRTKPAPVELSQDCPRWCDSHHVDVQDGTTAWHHGRSVEIEEELGSGRRLRPCRVTWSNDAGGGFEDFLQVLDFRGDIEEHYDAVKALRYAGQLVDAVATLQPKP